MRYVRWFTSEGYNYKDTSNVDLDGVRRFKKLARQLGERIEYKKNVTTMDKYTKKYIRAIKACYPDEQKMSDIIDKIYTDGFDDDETRKIYIVTQFYKDAECTPYSEAFLSMEEAKAWIYKQQGCTEHIVQHIIKEQEL